MSKTIPREIRELSARLLRGLDTPRSLTVSILVRYEEWDQLLNLKVDPLQYIDSPFGAEKIRRDFQATDLFRKCVDVPSSYNLEEEAIKSFWESERQCMKTNARLLPLCYPLVGDEEPDSDLTSFIRKVQKIIAEILGPLPKQVEGRFGPGAVFEFKGQKPVKGNGKTLGDKLTVIPAVTASARALFEHYYWPSAWGRGMLSEERYSIENVPGNRFTTVPKTAKTDRGICIEPGGNVFLQLGVGVVIRERLNRFGIDLNHGQELHKRLACAASLTGSDATIDLSSASDTVSLLLVDLLLPKEWYDLLFSLRSPKTLIRGQWVTLEKFSSMGNGFTFELETLIFASIAAAVSGGIQSLGNTVHCYGDDIIVKGEASRGVIAALRYFGFTPNVAKTFTTTAFRESCGGDYFCGYDVRPYYMKEFPIEPAHWITLANGLFRRSRNAHRREDPGFRARLYALDQLPVDIRRSRGPTSLGDIIVHDVEANWRFNVRRSQRWFRIWKPISRRIRLQAYTPCTQMSLALCGASSTGLTPRDSVTGYKAGWIAFS